jgi:hypothetical protein
MCARTRDIEIIARTPNPEQADHIWMLKNARLAYIERCKNISELVYSIEDVKSIIEFNGGGLGSFQYLVPMCVQLVDYRMVDNHTQCIKEADAANATMRSQRSDISFATQVGEVWQYEDVTPVFRRYKGDLSIVHYLSATPDQFVDQAVNQICRVTGHDCIIIDYIQSECKIDIVNEFIEENPDCEVTVAELVIDDTKTEAIYHVSHPL